MNKEEIKKIFKSHPQVRLAYLFGSQATGKTGPLSDIDFAVYVNEELNEHEMFDIKLELQDILSRALQSDRLDVIVLNLIQGPELKYNVVKYGKLLYEVEPYRVVVEPKILTNYFDFLYLLGKYNLTTVQSDD